MGVYHGRQCHIKRGARGAVVLVLGIGIVQPGEAKKGQKSVSQLAGYRSVRGPHLAHHLYLQCTSFNAAVIVNHTVNQSLNC